MAGSMKSCPSTRSPMIGTYSWPDAIVRLSIDAPSMVTSSPTSRPPVALATSPAVNRTASTLPDVIRLVVLFGGQSAEHEVSCVTAASVLDAVDRDRYDVVPIGITLEGR